MIDSRESLPPPDTTRHDMAAGDMIELVERATGRRPILLAMELTAVRFRLFGLGRYSMVSSAACRCVCWPRIQRDDCFGRLK